MSKRPKVLYCYKENGVQKWIFSDTENDHEIFANLFLNPDVDMASMFYVPAEGLMFGVRWVDKDAHPAPSSFIWDFFEEYNRPQSEIKQYEEAKELADMAKKDYDFKHNSKFGFISPEGKYFSCDYQGHHALARDICFGQYDTTNPEHYLEEHGWCKIYNSIDRSQQYAVYVGGKHVLTKEQMETITKLGLDKAKDIDAMLVKE